MEASKHTVVGTVIVIAMEMLIITFKRCSSKVFLCCWKRTLSLAMKPVAANVVVFGIAPTIGKIVKQFEVHVVELFEVGNQYVRLARIPSEDKGKGVQERSITAIFV
ncbi:hypothetical protein E2542_SST09487 [Spatholobus suberectus]|nr:hypothetical protein E2542_SST09487 [Spatholobus suberectus]